MAKSTASPAKDLRAVSGFGLILLENASLALASSRPLPPARPDLAKPPAASTPLQRQLLSLCLHHPFWNDFRILHYFQRRKVPVTINALRRLKAQCGLDNKETICNTLIRLSIHSGLELNAHQISFIERNKPEYRDRDLYAARPGELFVYECLFGRGIGRLGRVYIHLFIDSFTGYVFGGISRQRSLAAALKTLTESVLPVYRANNYPVLTVLHSALQTIHMLKTVREFDCLETDEAFSRLGIQWQLIRRKFGAIEKFERSAVVSHFWHTMPPGINSLTAVKPLFEHCLVRYNASNRLFSRRDLLPD